MTAKDKAKLAALKQVKSEAISLLGRTPSLEAKRAYTEACKELARFRYQVDASFRESRTKASARAYRLKKARTQEAQATTTPSHAGDHSAKLINSLKNEKNAARRAFFAYPTPETKEAFLLANAIYYKTRSQHDPDFRQARINANRRSRERRIRDHQI